MANLKKNLIDPKSGFSKANSTFYSKRKQIPLIPNKSLDVTTFISSQAHHGTTALIDAPTGRHVSFSELWRSVDSVADCLSQMGIRKGHVIMVMSPNSIFFPIVCLSVMSLGAIITTANPVNTRQELVRQIADCKPKLAFTTHQLVPKLAELNLPLIILEDASNSTTSQVLTNITEMIKTEPCQKRVRDRVNLDDTALLLYSSGTTGVSKGVMTSHGNLIALAQIFLHKGKNGEQNLWLSAERRIMCTVPLFHIYGLGLFVVGSIASGSTVVILPKFDMRDMLTAVQDYRVATLPLVPPILVAMVNTAEQVKAKYDLRSVKTILCGGASLSQAVTEEFHVQYPNVTILQGLGLTESTGLIASMDTLEESRKLGSVGCLVPSIEAKIVDPDSGKALTVNCNGELWVRGPSIMKGYFSNVEATSSTLDSEGWLRTGDICYIDEDGFIFIVDRLKEMIKFKGYQVPPAELEALLLTHPQISDAAVIPFPDKEVGQYPMAYVVRKAGNNLSESEVMDFVAKQVAPYKRIRKLAFVASVPKNPSGKILRKDLIKQATSNL